MADEHRIEEIVVANFNLLADSDDLNEYFLEEEVTQEEIQAVQAIVTEAEAVNNSENQDSGDDFEEESSDGRHATANAAKLDFYADANHTDSTKKQTKWAVNLFTGKYKLFSEIFK